MDRGFEQKSLNQIKRIVACDTLLIYPDFNKKMGIHTDDIDLQLGTVIIQDGKTITFYGHKLTGTQTSYTVTGKELLNIVETLIGSFTLLLGQRKNIYSYHIV